MRKSTFKTSNAFKAACLMPDGKKHQPGESFDYSTSEIVLWLISQTVIQKYLFDKMNEAGAIVFDKKYGTWRGSDSPKRIG